VGRELVACAALRSSQLNGLTPMQAQEVIIHPQA
jgi:hypothetical protein